MNITIKIIHDALLKSKVVFAYVEININQDKGNAVLPWWDYKILEKSKWCFQNQNNTDVSLITAVINNQNEVIDKMKIKQTKIFQIS